MKVLIKKPGESAILTEVDNDLKTLQKIVDGHIECVSLALDCVIICNEEGRINDLHYNCVIAGCEFFGTIIVAGVNDEDFCDVMLTEEQAKRFLPELYER
jgi:hypothetical protein